MTFPHHIITPLGNFCALYSAHGLASLDFPNQSYTLPELFGEPTESDLKKWQAQTETALNEMLSGKAPKQLPPLDISTGTEFQRTLWQQLLAIPLGRTRTYGELAAILGKPSASRAIGMACGTNPIPVIIPCHRVVAANGRMGGFGGGPEWKRRLLQIESILLA
ncbi:MAG TPA: methylated-DNA--[protein]-cysteine S-methyltransferase [Verrucomicrobiae bacterium]